VGFLRRAFGGGGEKVEKWPPPGPITSWPGDVFKGEMQAHLFEPPDDARVDVVGVDAFQETLEFIGGRRTPDGMRDLDHLAILVPEPANPDDPNAVRVVILPSKKGRNAGKVGYLSRAAAAGYRPVIDRLAALGKVTVSRATLEGGRSSETGDLEPIGVMLHLGTVAQCEAELAADAPT
jgi:hypothetical protein